MSGKNTPAFSRLEKKFCNIDTRLCIIIFKLAVRWRYKLTKPILQILENHHPKIAPNGQMSVIIIQQHNITTCLLLSAIVNASSCFVYKWKFSIIAFEWLLFFTWSLIFIKQHVIVFGHALLLFLPWIFIPLIHRTANTYWLIIKSWYLRQLLPSSSLENLY